VQLPATANLRDASGTLSEVCEKLSKGRRWQVPPATQ